MGGFFFFAAAPRAADGSASSDINKALDAVQPPPPPAWRADLSRLGHYAYAQVGALRPRLQVLTQHAA